MTGTTAPATSHRPRSSPGRRLAAVAAVGVTLVTSLLTAAGSAQAAGRDGICDSGEFCYYFNSGNAGSVSDFTGSISDLGGEQPSCYEYRGAGAGKGECVKNNAASVWNRTTGNVTVYFNSGYAGASQTIAAGQKAQLKAGIYNENAGHQFRSGGGTYSQAFIVREENKSGFIPSNVTAYQVENVKFIIAVGKGYGISAKGIQTAIATSIVESWIYNRYVVTDADSGGLFQQRPASGWGTYSQVRNKFLATKAFYGVASHTSNPGLKSFDYNSYSIGAAAQKVQRSAYPDRYQAQANNAISLYNKYQASVKPYTG